MGIFRYADPKCSDFTIAFVCCFTVREKNKKQKNKSVKSLTTNQQMSQFPNCINIADE